MVEKKAKPTRFLAPISWIVLLLGVPSLLYFAFVVGKLQSVSQQNLRLLSNAAERLERTLDNAASTARSLAGDLDYACEFLERQPRLRLEEPRSCEDLARKTSGKNANLRLEAVAGSRLRLVAEIENETAPGSDPANSPNGASSSNDSCNRDVDNCFKLSVQLDRVLADLPIDGVFDSLVIANGQGRVVAQQGARELRIASLDGLTRSGEQLTVVDLKHAAGVVEVHLAERDFQLLYQPLRSSSKLAGTASDTDAETWLLGGLVSSQRSLEDALAVSPLLVLLLVLVFFFGLLTWPFFKIFTMQRRERLRFIDAYLLSVSTLGILMLATLLLLDLESYSRLRQTGKERLAQLAVGIETNLRSELEAIIQQLEIYDRAVDLELGNDLDLEGLLLADHLLGAPAAASVKDDRLASSKLNLPEPSVYRDLTSLFWMRPGDGQQFIKATIRDRNTPQVRLSHRAYFTRIQQDDRLWNLTPGLEGAPGDSASRSSGEAGSTVDFYVEPIRSVTTGELSVVLSICSQLTARLSTADVGGPAANHDDPCPWAGEKIVAALSTPLVTLRQPVMGPGFGFAVIDSEGRVLFHSDSRRALDENLFDEIGDPRRLRAALAAGTSRAIETDYQSRPHHLRTRPVAELPWTIVTYLDKEILHTANLEILTQALLWALLYLLALFLIPSLFYLTLRRRQARSFWPDATRLPLYQRLGWIYSYLLLVAFICLHSSWGLSLAVGFLFPPLGILITAVCFRAWGKSSPPEHKVTPRDLIPGIPLVVLLALAAITYATTGGASWIAMVVTLLTLLFVFAAALFLPPWDNRQSKRAWLPTGFLPWYDVAAVLFWLLVAVLPASAFFKLALETQQELLLKMESFHVAQLLDHRACRVEQDYRSQGRAVVNERCDLGRRDVYFQTNIASRDGFRPWPLRPETPLPEAQLLEARLNSESGDVENHRRADWLRGKSSPDLLVDPLPVYNDISGRLRYLSQDAADDGSWFWHREPIRVVAADSSELTDPPDFVFELREAACGQPIALASGVRLELPAVREQVLIGGFLAILGLLFWIRYASRRLFFARMEQQVDRLRPTDLIRGDIRNNVIALLASPIDRRLILASKNYRVLDPDNPPPQDADQGQPVICDLFEDRLDDIDRRQQVLQVLEQLVANHRRVLIVSSVDPFSDLFSFSRPGPQSTEEESEGDESTARPHLDEQRRWGRLLSHFVLAPVSLRRHQDTNGESTPESDAGESRRPGWLEDELGATFHLRRLVERSRRFDADALKGVGRREVLERIIEAAEGYYWALWTACSEEEKLVLVQLAEEGLINPKQTRTVRRLLQRGLVVRDPVLRPMNESFTLFVSLIRLPKDVRQWERPDQGLGWAQVRWALLALLAVIALFLSTTQRQLLETTFGYVSALGLSVPVLLRLISSTHRSGPGLPES